MDFNENIDRFFKDRLSHYEAGPPETSWDAIATELGKKKKKKALVLFMRIAAGMAILLSTSLGIYYLTKPSNNGNVNKLSQSIKTPDRAIKNNNNTNTDKEAVREKNIANQKGSAAVMTENPELTAPDELISASGKNQANDVSAYPETDHLIPLSNAHKTAIEQPQTPSLFAENKQIYQPNQEEAIALLLAEVEKENTTEPEKNKKDSWSLGSEIAPLYSYRKVSSEQLDPEILSDINDNESGILAYAGGIRIDYSPGKRLSVQSGIYYSRYGQQKNETGIIQSTNQQRSMLNDVTSGPTANRSVFVSNSTGTISGNVVDNAGNNIPLSSDPGVIEVVSTTKYGLINTEAVALNENEDLDITLKQSFDYFEVPVIVKYKVIDRKIDFSFSGGLVTNFLVGNKLSTKSDAIDLKNGETTNINEINYQGSFGLGLEYPVRNKFAITLEPRFRYYLNSFSKSSLITVHPFSFGFFAGFNYSF